MSTTISLYKEQYNNIALGIQCYIVIVKLNKSKYFVLYTIIELDNQ